MELQKIINNNSLDGREKILELEAMILSGKIPNVERKELDYCPVKNTFAHKTYARQMFIPKGTWLTGEIHKESCHNIILKGDIGIFSEEMETRIKGPASFVSGPGIKKAGYAYEDTIWINIHPNIDNETDIKKIEERVIAKSYDEYNKFLLEKNAMNGIESKNNSRENCGLTALKKLTDIKKMSIESLIGLAKDNDLKLYAYRVKPNQCKSVALPAIFHVKDHFIYVAKKSDFDKTLKYTGNVLLTKKAKYPTINKSERKKITGASWAAAIGASVAVTGQIIGYQAKKDAARSECEKACDSACKAQTKWTEFKKRRECKAACKDGCVAAVSDPGDTTPDTSSGFSINPYYVLAGVIALSLIGYFLYKKYKK